ncbi:MAG TPA: c-type cytochrome [Vicinamibacterales bacterium]|nr:c-type cytochrome [Vicinamibacterales bacterium]
MLIVCFRVGLPMTMWMRMSAALALTLTFAIGSAGTALSAGDQATPNAAGGQKIYTAQKCSICHVIAGKGGKMGPDISKVGDTRDAAWLRKYLADPKSLDPKNKMPVVKLKAPDMEDLIAYLLTLKGA